VNWIANVIGGRFGASALIAAVGLIGLAAGAPGQEAGSGLQPVEEVASLCGSREITIAEMPWPSAAILAHIHSIVLFEQMGCAARVVSGDTASTGSSMATTQQPAIAPELWISRISEIWNSATSAGSVRPVANTYLGGPMEGWFVPGFVAEDHPELTSATQLSPLRAIFQDETRSRFVSCPADWACSIINANLMRAFHINIVYEAQVPADRFELDRILAQAISRRQPIVVYYWQPNAAISQFALKPLDLGRYNADAWPCLAMEECNRPLPSAFPPEPVVIAIAQWLQDEAPLVVDYLQQAIMPLEEMNRLLAMLNEEGSSPAEIARTFYDTREEVWRAWLPESLK